MIQFYLCKVPIRVRYSFLFLVSVFLLLEQEKTGALFFGAVFLHEIGHLAAMHFLHQPIQAVELTAFGIAIQKGESRLSLLEEAVVYLMGPAVNGLCVLFLLPWKGYPWCRWSVGFHLVLAMLNLLPIPPLDGGNLLILLAQSLSCQRAQRWIRGVVETALLVLFVLGGWIWYEQGVANILLFAVLLTVQYWMMQHRAG